MPVTRPLMPAPHFRPCRVSHAKITSGDSSRCGLLVEVALRLGRMDQFRTNSILTLAGSGGRLFLFVLPMRGGLGHVPECKLLGHARIERLGSGAQFAALGVTSSATTERAAIHCGQFLVPVSKHIVPNSNCECARALLLGAGRTLRLRDDIYGA